MKAMTRMAAPAVIFLAGLAGFAASSGFQKVSDHCYFYQSRDENPNFAAVVTADGTLLVDPPRPGAGPALEALQRLPSRPVRWVVNTDYHFYCSGGAEPFVEQGALLLGDKRLEALAAGAGGSPALGLVPPLPTSDPKAGLARDSAVHLLFEHQMRLFPGGVEIRVFAVEPKARTGGDVVIFIPSEKILIAGDLFVAGRFPEIDVSPGGGSPLGWLEGMKQVIDAVPLLKTAIPPKPEVQKAEVRPGQKPEEEKTLEEQITVLSAHGPPSTLQDMKDLLEAAQKLRTDLTRVASSRRDPDSFLNSSSS